MKIFSLFLVLLWMVPTARGEQVQFNQDELAKESVLPVFEKTRDVLDRHINTKGRLDLGVGAGLEINEPYYNDLIMQGEATYHFTNAHALNIQGIYWGSGLSSYGQQLKSEQDFDASKAPHCNWMLGANYQFTAYYGKISLTKQTVMNLDLFGLAGIDYINMDTLNSVGVTLGVGQNFYLSPNMAIRLDLRMLIFQGPDATSVSLTSASQPTASQFGKRMYFNNQLGLSYVFLL